MNAGFAVSDLLSDIEWTSRMPSGIADYILSIGEGVHLAQEFGILNRSRDMRLLTCYTVQTTSASFSLLVVDDVGYTTDAYAMPFGRTEVVLDSITALEPFEALQSA
jgi:hypothetical protein